MKIKNYFFWIPMLLFCSNINAQWEYVGESCQSSGNGNASSPKLALNGNEPYIVYKDAVNNGSATVKKYNGSSWEYVGNPGFSAGSIYLPSIAFYGGEPFVVYQDQANGSKATAMKFDGTTWVNVGNPGFSPGAADYPSIIFINDQPYVCFRDNANSNKASVMKFDGTSWVNVGNPGFSPGTIPTIILSIASYSGEPYVAFHNVSNGNKVCVMKYDGTAWVYVGPAGFSAGPGFEPSLAFNGGTPYVAYFDPSAGGNATVKKFDGTNWINVGSAGFTLGPVGPPKIAIHNNAPYVAFSDYSNCGAPNGSRGSVMKFDGTAWVNVGTSCFTHTLGSQSAIINSLEFLNSEPYVVFEDASCSNFSKTTVMKFRINTVGIQESTHRKEELIIYPNPAQNQLTLKSNLSIIGTEYKLIDHFGRILHTGRLNETDQTIDVEKLPEGVYFINAGNNITKKLTIKR